MTDYALTGKKGTGKSKNAVRLFRDRYLKRKRRCATNLDIDLKAMFGVHSKQTYVRVPDKPTAFDLLAAGHGNPESYDEDLNGGLFLDEMGTWLNTRTFADKERAATLDFFAHARKHGWDTYYIMQNVLQVDKQLREAFIEQTVRHTRFDKVRIPFIGWLLALLFGDKAGYLPRFHLAVARMGTNPQEMAADRATYTGKDIEGCYDTRQVFKHDYPHGTHSVLSPWHVEGRFLEPEKLGFWAQAWLALTKPPKPARQAPKTFDPRWARVVSLCRQLPPAERLGVMARYARASAGR
ncbi:zonular occludens toxin domain-containing protein [Variovorax sp. CAN2819]|uniref:zonular occludens toxin domain-containing protein n=1 Tax=Variovorax sp. CAN15 TaxID=3046727 RepID=UPI00264A4208|nr:zonular occludens toxin domain-containing protein [Variovorax sp. CAN15]MDN6888206.1 zonular occludens toxin domain-containing protein [Variovorax sp. CAN15]